MKPTLMTEEELNSCLAAVKLASSVQTLITRYHPNISLSTDVSLAIPAVLSVSLHVWDEAGINIKKHESCSVYFGKKDTLTDLYKLHDTLLQWHEKYGTPEDGNDAQ